MPPPTAEQSKTDHGDAALLAVLDLLAADPGDDGRPSAAARAQAAKVPDALREMLEEGGDGEEADARAYAEGFSGEKKDKLGRRRCYQDGKPVPCPDVAPARAPGHAPGGASAATPAAKAEAPPVLPMKPPPKPRATSKAPRNAEGKPVTGYAANGIANTYFGDLVEDALGKLGFENNLPPGQRSFKPGEVAEKGSSLDRKYDDTKEAFEVKAVCVEGTEFKAKLKASEAADKRKNAQLAGQNANTMIVVVDLDGGEAHSYWRSGIGAFAVNPDNMADWNYAGTVKMDAGRIAEAKAKTQAGIEKRKAAAAQANK